MSEKKIAIIASYASSLINFRGELIKKWVEMDFKVYALAPDIDDSTKNKLTNIGAFPKEINLNRTGLNPLNDLKTIYGLYKTLKELDVDIVYSYTIKPVIYGSIASKLAGVNSINSLITGLGYTFIGETLPKKIINKLAQSLYKIALSANNLVLFQNPDDQRLFIEKRLVKEEKTGVVNGSGVDIDHFNFSSPETDNISFLIICRLLKAKGVYEYIKAAELVKGKYPEVEFDIVGPYNPDNPDSIDENILNEAIDKDIVNFHSRQDDVRPYINDSSVYVLPSYREGTPRSVLEAMSMGRPIITSDVPGCRETVIDDKNGFLVPVRDHKSLAEKMIYFIENRDEIVRMGQESRKLAEEKYDVHKVNEDIIEKMGL